MKGNQKYDNGRLLHIEDYLKENKLKTKGNVEILSIFAVSSKEKIDTKTATNELLEKILSKDNLNIIQIKKLWWIMSTNNDCKTKIDESLNTTFLKKHLTLSS